MHYVLALTIQCNTIYVLLKSSVIYQFMGLQYDKINEYNKFCLFPSPYQVVYSAQFLNDVFLHQC